MSSSTSESSSSGAGASSTDRVVPSAPVRATDQVSSTEPDGPADPVSTTNRPSTSDRASPSILGHEPPDNNADDGEDFLTQADYDEFEAQAAHINELSMGIYGMPRPQFRHIASLREARDALDFVIDNTYLGPGRGRSRPGQRGARSRPPVQNDDSSSNSVSSASEDSNHSLPETHASSNSETAAEPPAKLRKISSPNKSVEQDGEICPICLDTWGNSGNHRLVSLKCGHLFGLDCVEKWLKAQVSKDRSCPTCKSKASLKDLRFIYARKLLAADNSEITRLQKLVDTLQAEKSRTELNLQAAKISQRTLAVQLEKLKSKVSQAQENRQENAKKYWRFALEKNLEICKDGGCRVVTYNCRTYDLYVSQKSANYLFPGYGIRRVSCVDYTLGQFLHLHPKPIRDIIYSQPKDLLLSVGLDCTARLVERGIPHMTINAKIPLWSCTWDYRNDNEFYVGGVGGMIHLYDIRNPSTTIRTFSGTGDMSPVVSVCSTEFGILSCQLNSCWLFEPTTVDDWVSRPFPVNGAFMSMCFDQDTRKAVISMRPKGSERSKLTVCSFTPVRGGVDIDVDYVINGSARTSVMSRGTFCRTPSATWIAAHSESDATLHLHGFDGSRTISLPAVEPALDVCAVQLNGNSLLAALSESRLRIYKAVQTCS